MSFMTCCVQNCFVSHGHGVTFHRFPNPSTDQERFQAWVRKIGGEVATLKQSFVFLNRRICHKHFDPIYYSSNNRLSKIAVPSIISEPDNLNVEVPISDGSAAHPHNQLQELLVQRVTRFQRSRSILSIPMILINSAREQIKAENPDLNVTEIAKKRGKIWMSMKDKSEWEKTAAEAREQYVRVLESYNAKMACLKNQVPEWKETRNQFYAQKQYNEVEGSDETEKNDDAEETYRHAVPEQFMIRKIVKTTDKPRRPMSAYMIWLNSAREQIKSENPGLKHTEIAKKGGEIWRGMKDKSEWEKKAAEAIERYTKDLESDEESDEYNAKMRCIKSEASIIKNIIHEGQKYVPVGNGSKVHFHFQTWKLGKERVLLDDSKNIGKKEPVDLIIGHKFKLEVWENIVKMMAVGEVASFQVKRELVLSYPLVSKTLRDLGREQKMKHSLLYNAEGTGYSDLDDFTNNPCDLEFIIEVLQVEDQEEKQDDKNALKKLIDNKHEAIHSSRFASLC